MSYDNRRKHSAVIIVFVLIIAAIAGIKCDTEAKPPVSDKPVVIEVKTAVNNPLESALKTGRPVVADFGRGTCIPCKMMKPILDELAATYKGRAEIFIFSIDDYRDLTEQYRIQLIPTQIFFDKSGKEVWRHEGFLDKDKIISKLVELGVK
ncbi:MAG: thioredoxin family protein [Candidatus Brocadiia bacterium]